MRTCFGFAGTLICLFGILTGCGSSSSGPELTLHPVSGTVAIAGKPAKGVSVTFVPADGAGAEQVSASGTTDETGAFALQVSSDQQGIPEGKYRVLFSRIVKPDGSPLGPEEMAADVGAQNNLPAVYSDPQETPIGADVPAGGKTFEFEIKEK